MVYFGMERSTLSGTRRLGSTQPSDISVLLTVRDSIYQAKRRTKSAPSDRHITNQSPVADVLRTRKWLNQDPNATLDVVSNKSF